MRKGARGRGGESGSGAEEREELAAGSRSSAGAGGQIDKGGGHRGESTASVGHQPRTRWAAADKLCLVQGPTKSYYAIGRV